MRTICRKLYSLFNNIEKKRAFLLILFSILISGIETLAVAVLMPFISLVTDFNTVETNEYFSFIYNLFSFDNPIQFIVFFGVCLVLFYIFRSIMNMIYVYVQSRFIFNKYNNIVNKMMSQYMNISYHEYSKKNSSLLTKNIVTEALAITSLTKALLTIISEVFVFIFIISMLLYVNFMTTISIAIFLFFNYLFINKIISKRIKYYGNLRESVQKTFYEVINKGFSNYKFIRVSSATNQLLDEFSDSSKKFSDLNVRFQTVAQFPRLYIESFSFCLIIILLSTFVWLEEKEIKSILPLVTIFVMALYRLMPSFNRIITGYNQMMYSDRSLSIITNENNLNIENLGNKEISFRKNITCNNIEFSYENKNKVLKNINLSINKNEKIAFIGKSGSGKSTLVDLLMGVYLSDKGNICIDEMELNLENIKSWRTKIGYIPQHVYLFEGTISENVVFGRNYDEKHLIDCLKMAKIYDLVVEKGGLNTLVGENGITISGGQKQRIAIARALYGNPEVLILDEATSALDKDTEKVIMDEIYDISNEKTLIIIAHRLSTISKCNKVYKLKDGVLGE